MKHRIGFIAVLIFICSVNIIFAQSIHWNQINSPGECPAITCFLVDGTALYVGTSVGTVFRSEDNADSWQQIGRIWKDHRIESLAKVGSTLFVCTDTGLFRTSDDGITFDTTAVKGFYDVKYVWRLVEFNNLLIAGTRFYGGGYSTDQGDSWTGIGVAGRGKLNVIWTFYKFADQLFLGQSYIAIAQTKDGIHWKSDTSGFPPTEFYLVINAFTSIGTILYAQTDSGFYRSIDTAKHWQLVNYDLKVPTVHNLAAINTILFAGRNDGVYRSLDSGVTWQRPSDAMTDTIRTLTVIGTKIFAGTDFAVYRSIDSGKTWQQTTSGLYFRLWPIECLATKDGNLFAGTDGGGVQRTTNSGKSWQPINSALFTPRINSVLGTADKLLAATDLGIFKSPGDGSPWDTYNTGLKSTHINTLASYGNTIYCGSNNGVQKNEDSVWSQYGTGILFTPVITIDANASYVFAGTTDDGIYRLDKSTAGAWEQINSGLTNTFVHTITTRGNTIFAGTHGSGVFRSLDNGATWSASNTGLTNKFVRDFASFSSTLFAAADGGVFRSRDEGLTWEAVNSGLTILSINSLKIIGLNLYASTNGNGIFTAFLGEGAVNSTASEDTNLKLFPNPAGENITVSYMSKSGFGQGVIVIRDLLGREVRRIVINPNENLYQQTINISSLSCGTYIVEVFVGSQRAVKQLNVVR